MTFCLVALLLCSCGLRLVRIDLLASKSESKLPRTTGAIYLRLETIDGGKKEEILSASATDALNQLRSPEDVAKNTGTSAPECMAIQLGMESPFYKAMQGLVEKANKFIDLVDKASAVSHLDLQCARITTELR